MNSVNRALWLDEAFLASSFSKRSFFGIFLEGRFEYLQSAPLGWLWFEKILTIIFGNTPYVLRMGSVIGFVLTLASLVFVQRYFFGSKFPFSAAALIANTPVILQYSNMFKPYIMDSLVALIAVIVFGLWEKKKISDIWLAVSWMVMICFSQTACFIIGGLGLCAFIFSCIGRDKNRIKRIVLIGVAVGASFLIYYFSWIRRMTSVSDMQNYWKSYFFPLFPKSVDELNRGTELLKSIFKQFDQADLFVMAFSSAGLILSILKRNRLFIGIYIGIFVSLFASYIKMYPVSDRLWCFCYPLFGLIAFVTLEEISNKKTAAEYAIALMMLIVITENTGYKTYSVESNVYMNNQELGVELDYLRTHMDVDDTIYVYSFSRPGVEYINGYGNFNFGGGTNNLIYGNADFDSRFEFDCKPEIDKILSQSKLWMVSSHTSDVYSQPLFLQLFHAMRENGYVELVNYQYNTPLWYFCKSIDDIKNHCTMSVQSVKTDGDWSEAVIHIENDGEAYLNNPYDDIFLINNSDGTIYTIKNLIPPGKGTNITVRYQASEEPEFVLRSQYGKFLKNDTIKIIKQPEVD